MACGWRSARPAGLHDAAAAASGMGLRSGASPRVVTREDLSTRCYLRSGRTPVVGPASFAAPPWRNCRSKMQIIGHFFALSKRARNNHCGSPDYKIRFTAIIGTGRCTAPSTAPRAARLCGAARRPMRRLAGRRHRRGRARHRRRAGSTSAACAAASTPAPPA